MVDAWDFLRPLAGGMATFFAIPAISQPWLGSADTQWKSLVLTSLASVLVSIMLAARRH